MFYCSSERNAPFFEIHPQVGDRLVLSEWVTMSPAVVNQVGYSRSNFEHLRSTRECPDWNQRAMRSPGFREQHRLVTEFLGGLFSANIPDGQEYLYKVTIAITEHLIPADVPEGAVRFDGLMYPTIAMSGNCDNFAFRSEFVARSLAFVKAKHLAIQEIDGMRIRFNVLDVADAATESGTLDWRQPGWTVKEHSAMTFIPAENGAWVAYAPDGTIVPPE
jgi:hypothetical protein